MSRLTNTSPKTKSRRETDRQQEDYNTALTEVVTPYTSLGTSRHSKMKTEGLEQKNVERQAEAADEETRRRQQRKIAAIRKKGSEDPSPMLRERLFPHVSVTHHDIDVSPIQKGQQLEDVRNAVFVCRKWQSEEKTSYTMPPHRQPCGHDIHPGLKTKYEHPRCPSCRMADAMNDISSAQQFIMDYGSIEGCFEQSRGNVELTKFMERKISGGKERNGRPGILDGNGNDTSYRHSKKRLVNLSIELEVLRELERTWELTQSPENVNAAHSRKMARLQYSATNAMALYEGAVTQGRFTKVEAKSVMLGRKRGRDWEVSTGPEYPDSDEEWPTMSGLRASAEQRKFIDASTCPLSDKEDTENREFRAPKRKRRRVDAKVSIHSTCYVSSEADVDELRRAARSWSVGLLENGPTSAPPEQPKSIIRTAPLKIDPKPKRPHVQYCTKGWDGPVRRRRRWCRKPVYAHVYDPGEWAVQDGSDNVDTSGDTFKQDIQGWQKYNRDLQQEADGLDADATAAEGMTRGR